MKNIHFYFLLILFFIHSTSSYTQDLLWLEVGSEWTYQHGVFSGPEHYQVTYGITEQTTFAGKQCAKMERISSLALGCMSLQPPFYFYVSNDSLFYANESDSTFRLIADFGASVGDSWKYQVITDIDDPVVVDTFLVTVTGVNLLNIEGNELRELELDYEWLGSSFYEDLWLGLYSDNLTEVIGGFGFFAPFGQLGFCDYEIDVNFQCFESPSFSYLNPEYPSCDYILGFESVESTLPSVFPNPTSGIINVEIPVSWVASEGTVQLFNSHGQIVYNHTGSLNNLSRIDLSHYSKGIYLLSIESGNERGMAKLVVD